MVIITLPAPVTTAAEPQSLVIPLATKETEIPVSTMLVSPFFASAGVTTPVASPVFTVAPQTVQV